MKPAAILEEWVKAKYADQLVKSTDEPYFSHLTAVAKMAGPLTKFGYEIGLCHDLLEDTNTTVLELNDALIRFGYEREDADHITVCVVELTDKFMKKNYPHLSKTERKEKEAARLVNISPASQTVKYADLIYNINWVLQYDPHRAMLYLEKKRSLLIQMTAGDEVLRQKALEIIENYFPDK